MKSIEEIWSGIEKFYKEHNPGGLLDLHRGASDEDLEATEESLGRKLPEDYKQSLRIHDGTSLDLSNAASIYGGWRMLGCEELLVESDVLTAQIELMNPATCIPFSINGCGDTICMDMGAGGRILFVYHDDEPTELDANYQEFLHSLLHDMESEKVEPEPSAV